LCDSARTISKPPPVCNPLLWGGGGACGCRGGRPRALVAMADKGVHTFGGIQLRAGTLPQLLRLRAQLHPKKCFLQIWSHTNGLQQTVTYEQLLDRVMQMRGALENLGVRKSARVALLSHNCVEYLVVGLALMALRAVPVHLNWRQPVHLLEETVQLSRCCLVFASHHFWQAARTICSTNNLRAPLDLVSFGQLLVDEHAENNNNNNNNTSGKQLFGGGGGGDDDTDAGQFPAAGGADKNEKKQIKSAEEEEKEEGDEMAVVFFTSGSTKTPKAVPHTHNELMWLAHQYVAQLDGGRADEDGGTLCLFPFFHVMGYVHNFVYNLYAGLRVVLHAETADTAISPEIMLRAIRELRPSVVNTVPYIVEGWCQMLQNNKDPQVQCVKDLRYISYGCVRACVVVVVVVILVVVLIVVAAADVAPASRQPASPRCSLLFAARALVLIV
jgi:acyl-CoA synthetase (AMP-forming)/AMP-acid ligase II